MHLTTRVRADENTSDIARRLGVTNAELVAANYDKAYRRVGVGHVFFVDLQDGEELIIPEHRAREIQAATLQPNPRRPGGVSEEAGGTGFVESPCPSGWNALIPGLCLPPSITPTTQDKPQGSCPAGFKQLAPNVCVPEGVVVPWLGGGEYIPPVPAPSGYNTVLPGLFIPAGILGPAQTQNQGPCEPGYVEIVPGSGICVDASLLGGGAPGTGTPGGGTPGGGTPGGGTPGGGTSATDKPTIEECRQYYGPNSFPVFYNGEWWCNTCSDPNEVIDPVDGLCMCRPGFERKVKGDGNSPCVPVMANIPAGYTKTDATEADCKSPSIWFDNQGCYSPPLTAVPPGYTPVALDRAGCVAPNLYIEGRGCFAPPPAQQQTPPPAEEKSMGVGIGAALLIGIGALAVGVLLAKSSGGAAAASPPAEPSPARDDYTPGGTRISNPYGDDDDFSSATVLYATLPSKKAFVARYRDRFGDEKFFINDIPGWNGRYDVDQLWERIKREVKQYKEMSDERRDRYNYERGLDVVENILSMLDYQWTSRD